MKELRSSATSISPLGWLLVSTGALALLVRLPFLVGPVDGRLQPDSGIYSGMVQDLLHGRGFATGTEFRTPGYPLLLAPLSFLPGQLDTATVVFQHLFGIAFTVGLVWAAWRWFGRLAAVLVAIVASLSPVLVNLEGDVLPDFVLGVAVVTGAFLLAQGLDEERPSYRWLAAAGVAFGIAALVKPVGQLLLLTAVVPLLVSPRRFAEGVRAGAVLAVCLLLTISPWIVRNVVQYGDVRMSTQDGINLWLRAFDHDKLPVPTTTRHGSLPNELYEKNGGGGAGVTNTYQYVFADLVHDHGYTYREATDLEREVAMAAIRDDPKLYVKGTAKIALKLGKDVASTAEARAVIDQKTAATPPSLSMTVSERAFELGRLAVNALVLLSLGFVSVILVAFRGERRRRAAALSLAVAWLALTLGTALAGIPASRYANTIVAMQWLLASAGAAVVLAGAWNAALRFRQRSHD